MAVSRDMKLLLAGAAALLCAVAVGGWIRASASPPAEGGMAFEWTSENVPQSASNYASPGAALVRENGENVLRIKNSPANPQRIKLAVIENPPLSGNRYQVRGSVRYEDVQGKAYLETLNQFGGPEIYHSRTLNAAGEMGMITGTSGWRAFSLPFHSNSGPPSKIEFILVMQGAGTIYVSGFEVTEGGGSRSGLAWWPYSWGGFAGAAFGVITGLLGMLGGMGKARRFVMAMVWLMLAIGMILFCASIFALLLGQPYHVWYPSLLIGVLTAILYPLVLIPRLRQTYEQMELRKIASTDVMR